MKPDLPARALVAANELAVWLGYECNQHSRVETWLRKNRIPFFTGKNGLPCTTLQAINSKLIDPGDFSEEDDFA